MKFIFLFALFFALFFLFPFITQAQSQECQNLLKENLSFQKLIERMVELEESWLCLSQYYNQNAGTDALNYQIQTDFSKLPNILFLKRIRDIVDQYAEDNSNVSFSLPPLIHENHLSRRSIIVLNGPLKYKREIFRKFTPSVFESFSAEMRRHLSMMAFRNRYLTSPMSMFATESISRHLFSDFIPIPQPQNMNTITITMHMPSFLLCQEPLPQDNHSIQELHNTIWNQTLQFFERNSDSVEFYLSALDFYNISQGRISHILPMPQHVIHSLPYGLDSHNMPESILQNLTEEEKETLFQLIKKLKIYTFTKNILAGYLNCLPNTFQEVLTVTYTKPVPSITFPASEPNQETSTETNFQTEWAFSFQYQFNEQLLYSKGVAVSPKPTSFNYSWIQHDESSQNTLLQENVPEFFNIEEPLLKILSDSGYEI